MLTETTQAEPARARRHDLLVRGLAFLLMMTALLSAGTGRAAPLFAVLEFDQAPTESPAENWAPGLADLMELALQQQGAALVTRRNIALILNERRVHKSGLIEDITLLRQQLPAVTFLIKGRITQASDKKFALEVSILDARSGTEHQSVSGDGRYPDDILATLDRVAAKIAPAAVLSVPLPAVENPGFSKSPEAMVMFYRGVESMLAGRPAQAESDFITAELTDSNFLYAVLWQARAYEALGMGDHAALERTKGRYLQERLRMPGGSTDSNAVIVTALFTRHERSNDPTWVTRIKNELGEGNALRLFEPDWLPGIADESDLRLSGEFGVFTRLDNRAWLNSDFAVAFSTKEDGAPARQRFSAQILNLASGTIQDVEKDTTPALCDEVARIIITRQALVTGDKRAAQPEHKEHHYYSGSQLPLALEQYQAAPQAWGMVQALVGAYPVQKRDQRKLVLHNYMTTIKPDDPQAAEAYASCLASFDALLHSWDGVNKRESVRDLLIEYIHRFTNTSAAVFSYQVGYELLEEKKPCEANEYFVRAANYFHDINAESIPAIVYFLPAYTSWKCQDYKNARKYLELYRDVDACDPTPRQPGEPKHKMTKPEYNVTRPPMAVAIGASPFNSKILLSVKAYGWAHFDGVAYSDLRRVAELYGPLIDAGPDAKGVTSFEACYERVMYGRKEALFDAGFQYCALLQDYVTADHREARSIVVTYAVDVLARLTNAATNETQRARIREWGLKFNDQLDHPSRSLLYASGNCNQLRTLLATQPPSRITFDYEGKLAFREHGARAQAERYAGLFEEWRVKYPTACDERYMAMMTASAWEDAGDFARAAAMYAMAAQKSSDFNDWLSITYWQANAEAKAGNVFHAVERLKQLTSNEASQRAWLEFNLHIDWMQEWIAGPTWHDTVMRKVTVYEEAARRLAEIRNATSAAAPKTNTAGGTP